MSRTFRNRLRKACQAGDALSDISPYRPLSEATAKWPRWRILRQPTELVGGAIMGADFSRVRFNPLRDYAGVELEQGRVLLDADINELMAIVDRQFRARTSDILGRATVSSTTPDAFKITVAAGTLQIGKGRLYVDGLLAENHGAASTDPAKHVFDDLLGETSFADPVRYDAQPYLPNPPAPPTAGRHLVYLKVWDREGTYLEQPDLVESAVGVDTSSRLQTVWQVRVLAEEAGAGTTCESPD